MAKRKKMNRQTTKTNDRATRIPLIKGVGMGGSSTAEG